jgi:hypothetical protein
MGQAPSAIVVGGGIGLVPGAIGQYLFLSSITPPLATTSARLRISGTDVIVESNVAGGTVIGPGTNDVAGGGANQTLIGDGVVSGVTSSPANIIAIGGGVTLGATAVSNILLGHFGGAFATLGTGARQVVIGQLASFAGVHNDLVSIGEGAAISGSANGVNVGRASSQTGAEAVAIGNASIAGTGQTCVGHMTSGANSNHILIGGRTTATGSGTGNIQIGGSCTTANLSNVILIGQALTGTGLVAGDVAIGNNNLGGGGFSVRLVIGGAHQHTLGVAVPAFTVRFKDAAGTDINTGDVTIQAPRATGTAAGASIIFQTTIPTVSSFNTQALGEVARFQPATATEPHSFQLAQDKGLWFINQTSGAGAAAGTLANAPSAGDPAHWLRVRINGTDMFIPCWT